MVMAWPGRARGRRCRGLAAHPSPHIPSGRDDDPAIPMLRHANPQRPRAAARHGCWRGGLTGCFPRLA